MILNLPSYIALTFALTTGLTLWLFVNAIRQSTSPETKKKAIPFLMGAIIWLALQAAITLNGVYNSNTKAFPPRLLLLGILPAIGAIVLSFSTKKGRSFIDSLPLRNLTWLNIIRIPVEIVLFWLFVNKAVPKLMTFEGRNFDIISGLTAPVLAYLVFNKKRIDRKVLLVGNIIWLALLLNIAVNAMLSGPFPFQQFAFDQPNIAILNFPFSWLPTFVVPVVLFGHLVSIRQLATHRKNVL